MVFEPADNNNTDNSRVRIDTPENVLLDAEIAGFGSRCLASAVDYFILGIIILILSLTVLPSIIRGSNPGLNLALVVLIQFVIITFYHLAFEFLWNGQTPGKRAFGLRVVMTNGLPLTTSAAIIRNIVRLFDFLPAFYGVGLVSLFATKNTQRLGDLAAGTLVIRERPDVNLHNVRETRRFLYRYINPYTQIPPYIQPSSLEEADIDLLVTYLSRRENAPMYDPTARLIGERLARRMGTIQPGQMQLPPADIFLEMVARSLELSQYGGAPAAGPRPAAEPTKPPPQPNEPYSPF